MTPSPAVLTAEEIARMIEPFASGYTSEYRHAVNIGRVIMTHIDARDSVISTLREEIEGLKNIASFDRAVLAAVRQHAFEEAANLYESINPASDDERLKGSPGAGAMGAVIEFRDLIRAQAKATDAGHDSRPRLSHLHT